MTVIDIVFVAVVVVGVVEKGSVVVRDSVEIWGEKRRQGYEEMKI